MQTTFLIFGIWIGVLSVLTVWVFLFFRRLSKQVGKGNLIKILESVLDVQRDNKKSIKQIEREIEKIEDGARLHIQKLGLVRFNPFKELGGDHSFSLALLDDKDNGVIITGLHTREKTRVYVKPIKKGKSKLKLSREESGALKDALK